MRNICPTGDNFRIKVSTDDGRIHVRVFTYETRVEKSKNPNVKEPVEIRNLAFKENKVLDETDSNSVKDIIIRTVKSFIDFCYQSISNFTENQSCLNNHEKLLRTDGKSLLKYLEKFCTLYVLLQKKKCANICSEILLCGSQDYQSLTYILFNIYHYIGR